MENRVVAYYKVETVQGKRFRLRLVEDANRYYQLSYRRGFWFSRSWEPVGNPFPDLVFIPAVIGRHFGYTAKYWKVK